tara:strand:+ start:799 stop:1008 length:210 start_codon:yes stop_codon:yes gene_type:complete
MAKHDYMGFSETLEDDDYGLIVSKDGTIKGIWVPRHLENEQEIPPAIATICDLHFGIDPNDDSNYQTMH